MVTLIAVYNSEGCVGRCDAHCYNAVHAKCECICGGKNHGAGINQAYENTRELAEAWLEANGVDPATHDVQILPKPVQLELW